MSDLTDRMRTCAAHIIATFSDEDIISRVTRDAADLLIEASNALEAIPPPLGEPMEIIPPLPEGNVPDTINAMVGKARWIDPGGALPTIERGQVNPRVCPKCDSRAVKRVRRVDNKLMIECPACSTQWEWKR